ncbi:MAG: hypothetical protein CTY16_07955 [Methylobacter sp.]|nr:MAG: hypothetical protein CTY16_07955 [Methylobacter sp.]
MKTWADYNLCLGSLSICNGLKANPFAAGQQCLSWEDRAAQARIGTLGTCLNSVAGGSGARRTERRNRNVLDGHEESGYRPTPPSGRVAAFKTRSGAGWTCLSN